MADIASPLVLSEYLRYINVCVCVCVCEGGGGGGGDVKNYVGKPNYKNVMCKNVTN